MPSAAETRLAWAVRAWEAELENASRLANRANLVLTIALAFSGFGLKELSDALRTHPSSWISQASLAIAVVGVTLIFWAFVKVLARRSSPQNLSRPPFASWDLLPPGDLEPVAAEEEMLTRAYRATSAAAYELHGRNATERERLNVAQQFLGRSTRPLNLAVHSPTLASPPAPRSAVALVRGTIGEARSTTPPWPAAPALGLAQAGG